MRNRNSRMRSRKYQMIKRKRAGKILRIKSPKGKRGILIKIKVDFFHTLESFGKNDETLVSMTLAVSTFPEERLYCTRIFI